ncbi:MAG: DUF192 domain-containing protein [Synechococcaceae bacterium WB7_3xG_012]|nr:DUF192 domain-containing protein [Synechococcaceae bacterium WB7_3xG_012]
MPTPALPPQQLPIEAQWCLEDEQPCIALEVARSQEQQRRGLQGRPPLAPLRGMWFPFPKPQPLRFWMHKTPASLDMVFLNGNRVIAIEPETTPCPHLPCRSYGPVEPGDGVVELGAGEAKRLGLRVGMPVVITPISSVPAGSTPD